MNGEKEQDAGRRARNATQPSATQRNQAQRNRVQRNKVRCKPLFMAHSCVAHPLLGFSPPRLTREPLHPPRSSPRPPSLSRSASQSNAARPACSHPTSAPLLPRPPPRLRRGHSKRAPAWRSFPFLFPSARAPPATGRGCSTCARGERGRGCARRNSGARRPATSPARPQRDANAARTRQRIFYAHIETPAAPAGTRKAPSGRPRNAPSHPRRPPSHTRTRTRRHGTALARSRSARPFAFPSGARRAPMCRNFFASFLEHAANAAGLGVLACGRRAGRGGRDGGRLGGRHGERLGGRGRKWGGRGGHVAPRARAEPAATASAKEGRDDAGGRNAQRLPIRPTVWRPNGRCTAAWFKNPAGARARARRATASGAPAEPGRARARSRGSRAGASRSPGTLAGPPRRAWPLRTISVSFRSTLDPSERFFFRWS